MKCLVCGQLIVMMCQQGTRYCSANCEDDAVMMIAGVGIYRYPMTPAEWVPAHVS